MGPFKPFPPFPKNRLAGPPEPYLSLSQYLQHYYSPKTEWVSGYSYLRRTGNALRPNELVSVPGYWRSSP